MSHIKGAKSKLLVLISGLMLVSLLQSCGDDDPISALACNWNDPFLCANEGDVKFKNTSTSRSIVRIFLVENCSISWGNGTSVNIAPLGSITYTLDSDEKYNIKADWSDNTCDTKFGIKPPHGGEKTQELTRDLACNINATTC